MQKLLSCNEDGVSDSKAMIREVFARYSGVLDRTGQQYLGSGTGSDTLGGADISFAALAGWVVLPKNYHNDHLEDMPTPEKLGPEWRAFSTEMGATRAGRHVASIYANHRLVSE